MTDAIAALDTALYNKLNVSAITTLLGGARIYSAIAPKDTPLPVIIFQWQGGGEQNLTPTRMRNVVYTVKAIATSKSAALDISAKVDAALHDQTLNVSGWTNYATTREDDVQLVEVAEDGRVLYHMGAIYRFRLGQ